MTDTTTDSDQMFAYGRNQVNGCDCPAKVAGYEPGLSNRDVTEVAEQFDEEVKELLREERQEWETRGLVAEDIAERAWKRTISIFSDDGKKTDSVRHNYAVTIAELLGWR